MDVEDKVIVDDISDKHDVESEKHRKIADKTVDVDRQVYQERLAKEIQKLEEENEKALQRHKEILAQRLEESVKQLENDQVYIFVVNKYRNLITVAVHRCGASGSMCACHAAGTGSIPGRDKFPG